MTWWPFGRKRRKAKSEEPQPAPTDPARTQVKGQDVEAPIARTEADVHPALREKQQAENERPWSRPFYSDKEKEVLVTPPQSLGGVRTSIENITALPTVMEGSPHLRPVPDPGSDSRIKRSDTAHSTPRRTPTTREKKIDDYIRLDQVRAMSSPIPVPDAKSDRRRKKDRAVSKGNNTSNSSLSQPAGTSIRSSYTAASEQHAFELGSFSIFSARPTLRHSLTVSPSSYVTASEIASRSNSVKKTDKGKERVVTSAKEEYNDSKTIDDLADNLSPASLKEIMERDRKRQEKKKDKDNERARRRLERHAAKVEAAEKSRKSGRSKRRQDEAEPVPDVPRRSSRREDDIKANIPPVPALPAEHAGASRLDKPARDGPESVIEAEQTTKAEVQNDVPSRIDGTTDIAHDHQPIGTEVATAPKPVVAAAQKPVDGDASENLRRETVEPTTTPAPATEPEDVPASTSEAVLAPVFKPGPEPVVEPTTEPVVEPTAEPIVEPTTEPVVEPTPEPTREALRGPVVQESTTTDAGPAPDVLATTESHREVELPRVPAPSEDVVAAAATIQRGTSPSSLYDGRPSVPPRSEARVTAAQTVRPVADPEPRPSLEPEEDYADDAETPFEEGVTQTAQIVRYSSASLTAGHARGPSGSPVPPSPGRVVEESLTEDPSVGKPVVQEPVVADVVEQPALSTPERKLQQTTRATASTEISRDDRRVSDTSKGTGTIGSLFRRIGAKKGGSTRSQKSERSFSNTKGTKSLPYQAPVHEWRDAYLERKRSVATGQPTVSKFHEDLPESPLMPASPELAGLDTTAASENVVEGEPGPPELTDEEEHTMSESLGTVDAEGSWLAGKSRNRSSQQMSVTRSSSKHVSASASPQNSPGTNQPYRPQNVDESGVPLGASDVALTGNGESNSEEGDVSPTAEMVEVQRATSVRQHVRHVSSGSAKLLDIPVRSGSNRASREMASTPEPPTETE